MANEVRTPPVNEIFRLHLPRAPGKCDWCGLPCNDRTPVRKQLRLRHYTCDAEIAVIQGPAQARWYVEERDHGICIDCKEDWSERYRFAKGVDVIHYTPDAADREAIRLGFFRSTEVIWVSLWHVDHRVPLWKVRGMPPVQRIEYFKLSNLVTRCQPCHKFKTNREASERAKFNDMAEDIDDPPPAKAKRAWGSRKLPTGRKMQSSKRPWPKRSMRGKRK